MRERFEADSDFGPVVVCDEETFAALPPLGDRGQSEALAAEAERRGLPCMGVDSVLVCIDSTPEVALDANTPFEQRSTLHVASRLVVGQPGNPIEAQRIEIAPGDYASRWYRVAAYDAVWKPIDAVWSELTPRERAVVYARSTLGVSAALGTLWLLIALLGGIAALWIAACVGAAWVSTLALGSHPAVRRMSAASSRPDARAPDIDFVVELRRIPH